MVVAIVAQEQAIVRTWGAACCARTKSWRDCGLEDECELSAKEPLRQGGDPGDGQKEIREEAEEVVERGEGPRWNVPVGLFQMDLVRLGSHGCLRGTELANYEHAYADWCGL